jgi:hypothetical protein
MFSLKKIVGVKSFLEALDNVGLYPAKKMGWPAPRK